jgi:hypothetical protein
MKLQFSGAEVTLWVCTMRLLERWQESRCKSIKCLVRRIPCRETRSLWNDVDVLETVVGPLDQ